MAKQYRTKTLEIYAHSKCLNCKFSVEQYPGFLSCIALAGHGWYPSVKRRSCKYFVAGEVQKALKKAPKPKKPSGLRKIGAKTPVPIKSRLYIRAQELVIAHPTWTAKQLNAQLKKETGLPIAYKPANVKAMRRELPAKRPVKKVEIKPVQVPVAPRCYRQGYLAPWTAKGSKEMYADVEIETSVESRGRSTKTLSVFLGKITFLELRRQIGKGTVHRRIREALDAMGYHETYIILGYWRAKR